VLCESRSISCFIKRFCHSSSNCTLRPEGGSHPPPPYSTPMHQGIVLARLTTTIRQLTKARKNRHFVANHVFGITRKLPASSQFHSPVASPKETAQPVVIRISSLPRMPEAIRSACCLRPIA
jgi:hypothetical protein